MKDKTRRFPSEEAWNVAHFKCFSATMQIASFADDGVITAKISPD